MGNAALRCYAILQPDFLCYSGGSDVIKFMGGECRIIGYAYHQLLMVCLRFTKNVYTNEEEFYRCESL